MDGQSIAEGFVFLCSKATQADCLSRGVFSSHAAGCEELRRIGRNTKLFLRNHETDEVFGLFQGTGPPSGP